MKTIPFAEFPLRNLTESEWSVVDSVERTITAHYGQQLPALEEALKQAQAHRDAVKAKWEANPDYQLVHRLLNGHEPNTIRETDPARWAALKNLWLNEAGSENQAAEEALWEAKDAIDRLKGAMKSALRQGLLLAGIDLGRRRPVSFLSTPETAAALAGAGPTKGGAAL